MNLQAYADYTLATYEDLGKYRDECVTKYEISPESVEKFKKWQFEDPKSPQYIECLFEKMHLFVNGNFEIENLAMQLSHGHPTDELKEKIKGCMDDTKTGADKAFAGFNCFKENNLYMIKRSLNRTH